MCFHVKRYTHSRTSPSACALYPSHRVRASPSGEGSTMFTAHSRATSQSLTTWKAWRSRRRSTRSNGFLSRTPPTFCSPPTVSHVCYSDFVAAYFRQNAEYTPFAFNGPIVESNEITFDFGELTLRRIEKTSPSNICVSILPFYSSGLSATSKTRLRWRALRMASAATRGACAGKRTRTHGPVPRRRWRPSARRWPADCGLHAWLLQKRWWRLEQMAKVPAVTRPRQPPRKLKEEEEKKEKNAKQPDCYLRLRLVKQGYEM